MSIYLLPACLPLHPTAQAVQPHAIAIPQSLVCGECTDNSHIIERHQRLKETAETVSLGVPVQGMHMREGDWVVRGAYFIAVIIDEHKIHFSKFECRALRAGEVTDARIGIWANVTITTTPQCEYIGEVQIFKISSGFSKSIANKCIS